MLTDKIVAELERMAAVHHDLHPTWVRIVAGAVLEAQARGEDPEAAASDAMNKIVRGAVRAFAGQAVRYVRRLQAEAN